MKTLIQYMESRHLNQVETAKKLGVDKHVMNKWLRRKRMPSNDSLQRIAQLTGSGVYDTMREWGAIK